MKSKLNRFLYAKIDDKTGYIVLSHLKKASNETKRRLEELKNKVERIILDVRDNPGGLLNEAVIFAIYSFSKRDIVTTKSKLRSTTVPIKQLKIL
jgi:carboxyl-terminal processing protease